MTVTRIILLIMAIAVVVIVLRTIRGTPRR